MAPVIAKAVGDSSAGIARNEPTWQGFDFDKEITFNFDLASINMTDKEYFD